MMAGSGAVGSTGRIIVVTSRVFALDYGRITDAGSRTGCALTGAVSGIAAMATNPTPTAAIMYQAGASGLPVVAISQVTTNCAVPPNVEIASAYVIASAPDRTLA